MSDEIKEIINELENIIKISDYKNHYHLNEYFEIEHIDKLLIYIKNYKLRIEKAIEYIKKQDMSYYGAVVETKMDIILNILQGGKDE